MWFGRCWARKGGAWRGLYREGGVVGGVSVVGVVTDDVESPDVEMISQMFFLFFCSLVGEAECGF